LERFRASGGAPFLRYWSVGGLETVPSRCCSCWRSGDPIREQAMGHGRPVGGLDRPGDPIRPETPLLAAAFAMARWLDGPAGLEGKARDIFYGAGWSLSFCAVLLFRHFYFGDWLPNTY